ncbi:hypothetical protein GCM10027275_08070 [Rhabdobacter roseus]|uniref:Putative PurR-regulated permease PerM n=1 Tax=Rhabdobacter roseus TaxID=1655419 RepID=A0A840TLQ1_9BACT|nr:hypothetical protein [Rhabdobacter roseus]MBB5282707.1 putative PurR-regulated permease PerM [Rhabdobacter roseus]
MIILSSFLILSILFLIVFAFFVKSKNQNVYTKEIGQRLAEKKYSLVKIEPSESIEGLNKENSVFITNYGTSPFFKIFKKITFRNESDQIFYGYAVIKLLFFFVISIKIYDDKEQVLS